MLHAIGNKELERKSNNSVAIQKSQMEQSIEYIIVFVSVPINPIVQQLIFSQEE